MGFCRLPSAFLFTCKGRYLRCQPVHFPGGLVGFCGSLRGNALCCATCEPASAQPALMARPAVRLSAFIAPRCELGQLNPRRLHGNDRSSAVPARLPALTRVTAPALNGPTHTLSSMLSCDFAVLAAEAKRMTDAGAGGWPEAARLHGWWRNRRQLRVVIWLPSLDWP